MQNTRLPVLLTRSVFVYNAEYQALCSIKQVCRSVFCYYRNSKWLGVFYTLFVHKSAVVNARRPLGILSYFVDFNFEVPSVSCGSKLQTLRRKEFSFTAHLISLELHCYLLSMCSTRAHVVLTRLVYFLSLEEILYITFNINKINS